MDGFDPDRQNKKESAMSTVKEEAINLITRLPDEAGWDDIMYEMYVKKKTNTGSSCYLFRNNRNFIPTY